MYSKSNLIGVVAALGLSSAQALTVLDLPSFNLEYDESKLGNVTVVGGLTGAQSLNWNLQSGQQAISVNGAPVAGSFELPWMRATADAGYEFAGTIGGFMGNLVYNLLGPGASVGASVSGNLSVDGGAIQPFVMVLTPTITAFTPPFQTGFLAGSINGTGATFSVLEISDLRLNLLAGGGSFASVIAQPQNIMSVMLDVAVVPEPQTLALMLAGLGVVASVGRRRHQS
jgi:PEP-CTERM motif